MQVLGVSEINVLYTFDTRFWKLALVSMVSMLKNRTNKDAKCTIFCMVAPGTRGYRKIEKTVQEFGADLVWRVVRKYENPYRGYNYSRWSPVIFYRLNAHNIFPNVKKMLYMDSDTIVNDDLTELFNTDLSDWAMGAIQDMAPTEIADNENGQYVKDFAQKYLGNGPYFNSGVLLLNLEKMREYEKDLRAVDIELTYPDQDVLNAGLKGKIYPLPMRYNFAPGVVIPQHFQQEYQKNEKIAIYHFYTIKPYIFDRTSRDLYSMFYKYCMAVGMHPDDFMEWERRYLAKRYKNKYSKLFKPLRVYNNRITLYGFVLMRV